MKTILKFLALLTHSITLPRYRARTFCLHTLSHSQQNGTNTQLLIELDDMMMETNAMNLLELQVHFTDLLL